MLRKVWRRLLFAALLALGVPPATAEPRVLVFAAASLKDALDEITARWRHESGARAIVSYASSSALVRQIEAGAPADLFISADLDWMDHLERRALIRASSRINLLGNRLVLIAAKHSALKLEPAPGFPIAAALGGGRLATANTNAVPAGRYGKAALSHFGVWSAVAERLAQAENVRAALVLVARGEAPLGIVYETDARADPRVRIIARFPPESHPPIVYPAALTARAAAGAPAALLADLRSPAAKTVWQRHGFSIAGD